MFELWRPAALVALTYCLGAVDPRSALAAPCAGGGTRTCDDGSVCADASACPGQIDCVSDCVVGGTSSSDCYLNLLGVRPNQPQDAAPGAPKAKKELRCTDGDPLCDRDGIANNVCEFAIAACLDNGDPNLPGCDPALGVTAFVVKNKKKAKFDPELANLQTRGGLLLPASTATCSDAATIRVRVKDSGCATFKSGKNTIKALAISGPDATGKVHKDSDQLKLACLPSATPECGRVMGQVREVNGVPIPGASVSAGSHATTTAAGGIFTLELADLGSAAVQISKTGYVPSVRLVDVAGGADSNLTVTLLRAPVPAVVPADAGGVVQEGRTSVTFPAAAFVDVKGTPVSGESVHVTLAPLDPTSDEIRAFPGGFAALDGAGGVDVLETVALADIVATTDKGEPLQLAPSHTAALELPIAPASINPSTGLAYQVGDTTPMYWLNPTTGMWEPEGTGMVGTSTTDPSHVAVFATIRHLSWWNADNPMQVTCLTGQVVNGGSMPIAGAEVTVSGLDYMGRGTVETDSGGSYCILVRVDSSVALEASAIAADGIRDRSPVRSPIATPLTPATCGGCLAVPDLVIGTGRTCVTGHVERSDTSPASGASVASSSGTDTTAGPSGDYCLSVASNALLSISASDGTTTAAVTLVSGGAGGTCTPTPTACTVAPRIRLKPGCGNGLPETGEDCDLGAALNGGPESTCSTTCTTLAVCGNDLREGLDEECDGADAPTCSGMCGAPAGNFPCLCLTKPRQRVIEHAGPSLDLGWTGFAHDVASVEGGSYLVDLYDCDNMGNCTVGPSCALLPHQPCTSGAQCTGVGNFCRKERTAVGPHCQLDIQTSCSSNAECSGTGNRCVKQLHGPPLPLAAGGVSVCGTNVFIEDVVGTTNLTTGAGAVRLRQRLLIHAGGTVDQPCPVCGGFCAGAVSSGGPGARTRCATNGDCPNAPNVCVTDSVCSFGANVDKSCRPAPPFGSSTPFFGSVSIDCPPDPGQQTGGGLDILFNPLTTGSVTLTPNSPCTAPGFGKTCVGGPNVGASCTTATECPSASCNDACFCPPSSGNPEKPNGCDPACVRGSNDAAPCLTDSACPGGFCHQADCRTNPSDTDSSQEGECVAGPVDGHCSTTTFQPCVVDGNCQAAHCPHCQPGETCTYSNRQCFVNSGISRAGTPGVPNRTAAAVFCLGASSSAVDAVLGLPGPGTLTQEMITVETF